MMAAYESGKQRVGNIGNPANDVPTLPAVPPVMARVAIHSPGELAPDNPGGAVLPTTLVIGNVSSPVTTNARAPVARSPSAERRGVSVTQPRTSAIGLHAGGPPELVDMFKLLAVNEPPSSFGEAVPESALLGFGVELDNPVYVAVVMQLITVFNADNINENDLLYARQLIADTGPYDSLPLRLRAVLKNNYYTDPHGFLAFAVDPPRLVEALQQLMKIARWAVSPLRLVPMGGNLRAESEKRGYKSQRPMFASAPVVLLDAGFECPLVYKLLLATGCRIERINVFSPMEDKDDAAINNLLLQADDQFVPTIPANGPPVVLPGQVLPPPRPWVGFIDGPPVCLAAAPFDDGLPQPLIIPLLEALSCVRAPTVDFNDYDESETNRLMTEADDAFFPTIPAGGPPSPTSPGQVLPPARVWAGFHSAIDGDEPQPS